MQDHQDIHTFLVVAETESFTKAAAQLGVSRSAISHTINQLERRLNLRLFHRTTRKVSTSEAGERLYRQLRPLYREIDQQISQILAQYDRLQGNLRLTLTNHAARELWGKLTAFRQQYPHIALELNTEIRKVDLIAERFDAGVRMGDFIDKDMVAVRVSESMPMCCAASPDYWQRHGKPQRPADLQHHQCLRLRLPTHGDLLNWGFVSPQTQQHETPKLGGNLILSDEHLMLDLARDGQGIAWVERSFIADDLAQRTLDTALDDWAITYPPYYLYYPNRNQSPLLQALIEALKA